MSDSQVLLDLLQKKHDRDKFFPECLMGAGGSRRFDAWVLRTTWSPLTAVGYEIKQTRSDFLRDTKWPDYLPACHEFYFVAPAGIIDIRELPEGVGLMLASKNGARLFTKRRAPRREPDPSALIRVMAHTIMWEESYATTTAEPREDRLAHWRKILEDRAAGKRIGRSISIMLSDVTNGVMEENEKLHEKLLRWGGFRAKLLAHGIDPNGSEWTGRNAIDRLAGSITPATARGLRRALSDIERAADLVDELLGR